MILSKDQVDPMGAVCLFWVPVYHPSVGHWGRTVPGELLQHTGQV